MITKKPAEKGKVETRKHSTFCHITKVI